MRRTFIATVVAVFALGCSEVPTSPLLSAAAPSFDRFTYDNPPPPFAVVDGSATTEHGTFSFTGHLFINKPGNVAWLQFQSTTTAGVSFSPNARIMSVNGDVSGVGTISIGDNTIHLNGVNSFTYQTYRTTRSVSFGGGSILRGTAGTKGLGLDDVISCTTACFDGGKPKGPGR